MKVAVKDANVFIDLESMGILDLWFQLDYQTITSSFVVVELEEGGHVNALASIQAGQVIEAVIESEEMERFEALRAECEPSGLSPADVSVLYLAIRENAILLSGDKSLRNQAKLKLLGVHGTLWMDHGSTCRIRATSEICSSPKTGDIATTNRAITALFTKN